MKSKKFFITWSICILITTIVVMVLSSCENHEHTYNENWSYDSEYHWKKASCEHSNETKDKDSHAFDSENKCMICLYQKENPIAENYNVTYDANGGSFENGDTVVTTSVESNSILTPPVAPQRIGCTFSGWSRSKDSQDMWRFSSDTATGDVTLYATWSEESASIFSIDGATIDHLSIFMFIDKDTESVSLSNKVVCSSDSIWKLYYDKLGQTEIPTKIAASMSGELNDGDNIFYIVVTSNDGAHSNVYELTIHRSYSVPIDYCNGENLIYTDYTYTGYNYDVAYTPNITGYTFNCWENSDGNTVTTLNTYIPVKLYANKTANTYRFTYDANNGSLNEESKQVMYDSDYKLPVPTRTGYTFNGWYKGRIALTDANGNSLSASNIAENITVRAEWSINYYTATLQTNDSNAGSVSAGGEYSYNSSVTIRANANLGYTFLGWYDGDNLITNEPSYTFVIPAENTKYTAKFEMCSDMSNFEFASTSTICTITGIKDKTVTEIVVPNYVTNIDGGAFSGCSSLERITLPFVGNSASATSASRYTLFGYIFGSSSYENSSSVKQFYDSGTYDYSNYYIPTNLKSVKIKGGNILYGAFYGCKNLTSITLPDNIRTIKACAFRGCSSITSIIISDNITSIGEYAFLGCTGLTSVFITDITSWCNISFANAYANPFCGKNADLYINDELITDLIITDNVTTLRSYAFYGCKLKSITVPDSVTTISESTFNGCSSLESITLPFVGDSATKTVWDNYQYPFGYIFGTSEYSGSTAITQKWTEIYKGNYTENTTYYVPTSLQSVTITGPRILSCAFHNCTNLTSVTIGDNVTIIGSRAFYGCTGLTSITFEENSQLATIDSDAFYGCGGLTSVFIADITNWCKISFYSSGGYNYANPLYYAENLYLNGNLVTDLIIPDNVTSIGSLAFIHCTGLKSITIGDNVTKIGSRAFYGCTGLTSITFEENSQLTEIDSEAFYGCGGLTSVTIGDNVTRIGIGAFKGCTDLTSVTFEDPNGWYFGGNSISSNVMADNQQAAKAIKETYLSNVIYKSEN